jgi:hypothetical protein
MPIQPIFSPGGEEIPEHVIVKGNLPDAIIAGDLARVTFGDKVIIRVYRDEVVADANFIGAWQYKTPFAGALGAKGWHAIGPVMLENATAIVRSDVVFDATGNGLGVELYTESSAAADPNGTEINDPGVFDDNQISSTVTSVADPSVGTWAIQVLNAGVGGRTFLQFAATIGAWYRISMDAKRGVDADSDQRIGILGGFVDPTEVPITTGAYAEYLLQREASSVNPFFQIIASDNGASVDTVLFDNLSVREMVPTNVVSVADAALFAVGQKVSVHHLTTRDTIAKDRVIEDVDLINDILTLSGAPFVVQQGYTVLTQNEFGPWDTYANGALFTSEFGVPETNYDIDGTGLVFDGLVEGNGIMLPFMGSPGNVLRPHSIMARMRYDIITAVDPDADAAFGLMCGGDQNGLGVACVKVSTGGGRWGTGAVSNVWPTLNLALDNNMKSPATAALGTQTDLISEVTIVSDNAGNVGYQTSTKGGQTITQNRVFQAQTVGEATAAFDAIFGPNIGPRVFCQKVTGVGDIKIRVKEIEYVCTPI